MAETRDLVERLRGNAAYLRGLLSAKPPYVFTDVDVGSLMERQEKAADEIEALRSPAPTAASAGPAEAEPPPLSEYDEGYRAGMEAGARRSRDRTLTLVTRYADEEISTGKLAEELMVPIDSLYALRAAVQGPVGSPPPVGAPTAAEPEREALREDQPPSADALDDICHLIDAPAWEYPGQVVRDVAQAIGMTPEEMREKLKTSPNPRRALATPEAEGGSP
jgi:hypothetical protein